MQRQDEERTGKNLWSYLGRPIYKLGILRFSNNVIKSKKLKLLLLAFAGFIFFTLSFFVSRKPEETFISISDNEIEEPIQAVAALGQIAPTGETRLLAAPLLRTGGIPRISKILVDEGEEVNIGQVLAIFDNRSALLADLNIAKNRLNTVQANIIVQSRQVSRYQQAALEGATPLSVLDNQKDILNNLIGRQKELESEIIRIKIDIDQTELKSPIDGIVLKVNYREGERPGSDGVFQVGRNRSMEALIEVYESDISRVKIGQNVILISENGGFDGDLKGIVSRISPQIQQRNVLSTDPTGDADARIVKVRVTLDQSSSEKVTYFTGMKVIARFQPK